MGPMDAGELKGPQMLVRYRTERGDPRVGCAGTGPRGVEDVS